MLPALFSRPTWWIDMLRKRARTAAGLIVSGDVSQALRGCWRLNRKERDERRKQRRFRITLTKIPAASPTDATGPNPSTPSTAPSNNAVSWTKPPSVVSPPSSLCPSVAATFSRAPVPLVASGTTRWRERGDLTGSPWSAWWESVPTHFVAEMEDEEEVWAAAAVSTACRRADIHASVVAATPLERSAGNA